MALKPPVLFLQASLALLLFGSIRGVLAQTFAPTRFISVINECNGTVWPAYASTQSTVAFGKPNNPSGGWRMESGSSQNVTLPSSWVGAFWGRQDCDFSQTGNDENTCLTGSCPGGLNCTDLGNTSFVTLADLDLNNQFNDTYGVNIASGFNLPIGIQPGIPGCVALNCPTDFNQNCPPGFQAVTGEETTLACKVNSTAYSWYSQGCPQAWNGEGDPLVEFCASQGNNITITFCPGIPEVAPPPSFAAMSSTTSTPTTSTTSTTSSASSTSPSQTSLPSVHHISKGAIAGIVIGAIAGALAFFAMVIWVLARRRRHQTEPPSKESPASSSYYVDPLILDERPRTRRTATKEKSDLPEGNKKDIKENLSTLPDTVEVTASHRQAAAPTASDGRDVDHGAPVPDGDTTDQLAPRPPSRQTPPELEPERTGADRAAIDIHELFEDREFENDLLYFLTQRMDPQRIPESPHQSEYPPSYRPAPGP